MKNIAHNRIILESIMILKISSDKIEMEIAKEEIMKIATLEINKLVLNYVQGSMESISILDTGNLNKMYNFNNLEEEILLEISTLHPIYDLKQDCLAYLFETVIYEYDFTKGASFKTFVYQKMRGYLQRIYHKKYRTISLTSNVIKNYLKDVKNYHYLSSDRKKELSELKPILLSPYGFGLLKKDSIKINKSSNEIKGVISTLEKILTNTECQYLMMSVVENKSNKEIAEIFKVSPPYVCKILKQAKEKAKQSKELERMCA